MNCGSELAFVDLGFEADGLHKVSLVSLCSGSALGLYSGLITFGDITEQTRPAGRMLIIPGMLCTRH